MDSETVKRRVADGDSVPVRATEPVHLVLDRDTDVVPMLVEDRENDLEKVMGFVKVPVNVEESECESLTE